MPKGVAVTSKRREQSVIRASGLSGVSERDRYENDAINGSTRLYRATMGAILRFAEANRIDEADARLILLGKSASGNVRRLHLTATDHTGHRPDEIRSIGQIIRPIVERVREAQG